MDANVASVYEPGSLMYRIASFGERIPFFGVSRDKLYSDWRPKMQCDACTQTVVEFIWQKFNFEAASFVLAVVVLLVYLAGITVGALLG